MLARGIGLTELSSLFHDRNCQTPDIQELRHILVEMDGAVSATYGWSIVLGHDFHQTKQGTRYSISEVARQEVLDRLLALNHERYAQEQIALESGAKIKQRTRKRSPAQPALF